MRYLVAKHKKKIAGDELSKYLTILQTGIP
jgi:hypothetical protein